MTADLLNIGYNKGYTRGYQKGREDAIEEYAEKINKLFEYESAWYKTEYHNSLVIDRNEILKIAEQLKTNIQ